MNTTPVAFDIHFESFDTGETIYEVANQIGEIIKIRVTPNGDINVDDIESYKLSVFDNTAQFSTNSIAHFTAKTVGAIWGFMPGLDPENEMDSTWQAALLVSNHYKSPDISF